MRHAPWFVPLALVCSACGDSPREVAGPASVCGEGHLLLELVGTSVDPTQATREVWCAEDTYACGVGATCGVADGPYESYRGGVLMREGSFAHGQPSGRWTDWYPSAGPRQQAMTYGFRDGLADGDFVAFFADGTTRWERAFAAGRACGVWRTMNETGAVVREVDHGPCDAAPVGVPTVFPLVSPRVTDFGWDGGSCPAGTRDEAVVAGVTTVRCLPTGPYRRTRGEVVLEVGTVVDGAPSGTATTFFPPAGAEGQRVATSGSYTAGVKTGTWHFYRADGSLERRGPFVAGLEEGPWEGFHPSLLKAWSGSFDGGLKNGVFSTYHDAATIVPSGLIGGLIATEETWVDGVRHGAFEHWFPSGAVERQGQYVHGAWSGLVTTWWESGEKRYATTYRGGMANGPHEAWDPEGRLDAKGRFEFGRRVGPWLGWVDPNPLVLFFGGGHVRTRTSVTFEGDVAQGPMLQHYSDMETGGPIAGQGFLRDGFDEGDFTLYWRSGEPLVEGVFEGGAAQGPWQSFYEDGAERATWPFARGLLHGPFLERHDNGQKKREGAYADDRRVGTWTTYDASGAMLTIEECGLDGSGCDCTLAPEGCR